MSASPRSGCCRAQSALTDALNDAHILDVLPTMWPSALAFFEQAAASLIAAAIDDTLELII
eukprot:875204-Pleurochrysis_carterae.AAC.1